MFDEIKIKFMKTDDQIKDIAIEAIQQEGKAVLELSKYIDFQIVGAVKKILDSNGRLVVTGVGKSANIARKLVATFNSTGQSASFMHAGDAIHGDLGNIQSNDIVVFISKSGNTDEIKLLLPIIKVMSNTIISITGNVDSYLASKSDFILNSSVDKEACPNNLAPTTSSTAQLVIGDVLAICLLECRDFKDTDFARFHPGGFLGKRLFLKVTDLCSKDRIPNVMDDDDIKSVIFEISDKRLGATAVLNENKVVGIITDGDIRRMLESNNDINRLTAKDIMCCNPKIVDANTLAVDALKQMKLYSVTQLLVFDKDDYLGIVHLHDILKEGIN